MGLSLEISIPVYNEENRLARGLDSLLKFRTEKGLDFKIAIADNGSVDGTRKISESYASRFPFIRYVQVEGKGVGRALKKAWSSSSCDLIGYMDVDLSTHLDHLLKAIQLFEDRQADVVNGSRLLQGSRVVGRKLSREVSSRGFNFLLKVMLGVNFTDGMCGFKFLRRSSFLSMMQHGLKSDQWFFNAEILIKAEWLKLKVVEIPVTWEDDPDSKAKIIQLAIAYTKEMMALRRDREQWVHSSQKLHS